MAKYLCDSKAEGLKKLSLFMVIPVYKIIR